MSSNDNPEQPKHDISNALHLDLSEELLHESAELEGSIFRARAKSFLVRADDLAPFTPEEASWLVQRMHPYSIPAGEWFILEDDQIHNNFMMLILAGQVVVEATIAAGKSLTVSVLHEGSWVGELGILDSQPRQAACRASDDADVACAILSRKDLLDIIENEPRIAAKLALMLATNVAGYVRRMNAKVSRYAEIQNAIRGTET